LEYSFGRNELLLSNSLHILHRKNLEGKAPISWSIKNDRDEPYFRYGWDHKTGCVVVSPSLPQLTSSNSSTAAAQHFIYRMSSSQEISQGFYLQSGRQRTTKRAIGVGERLPLDDNRKEKVYYIS
jgi:hypothetical protein